MNPFASSYVAKDTFLHRLPPGLKLLLLAVYAVALFNGTTALQVLLFLFVIVSTVILLGLPLNNRISLGVTIAVLIVGWYFDQAPTVMQQIALAVGKVVALNLMIALFNMTTRTRDLLALLGSAQNIRRYFGPALFMVSTMITVTPTIERDIRRAIDAETLRRGSPLRFSLSAWIAILVILLNRVMRRAEALTTAMMDRGYSPSSLVTLAPGWENHWQHVIITILLAVPAIVILIML